jgi:DNA-binding transcriptional ArsR family regulator
LTFLTDWLIINAMVNQLADTFVALADPTRFRVVEMLGGQELSAGEIAARCSISGPALSRHLRVLRRTGLVEVVQNERAELDARLRVYRLRPEQFSSVKEWIDQMQAFWMKQLSAFKSYAEGKQDRPSKGLETGSGRGLHRKKVKGRPK